MNNYFKQTSTLARIGLVSWIRILVLAVFSTVSSFLFGIYYFFKSIRLSEFSENNWWSNLIEVFTSHLFSAFLLFLVFNSIWLLIYLGNEYVTYKIIHQLVSDNSEKIIEPILDKSLASLKQKFPNLMQKGANFSMTKLKLIEEIKSSKEKRFMKKIILLCLDQVYLADVDLKNENITFETILKFKIIQILKGITEPTRLWILVVILFQWLVVIYI